METLTQLKNKIYGVATGTPATGTPTGGNEVSSTATGNSDSMQAVQEPSAATGYSDSMQAVQEPTAAMDSSESMPVQGSSAMTDNSDSMQGPSGTGADSGFQPDIENATNREITPDAMAIAGGASVPIQPNVHMFTPPTTGGDPYANQGQSSLSPDGVDVGQELNSRQATAPIGGHSAQEATVAAGSGLNELEQE